MTVQAGDKAPNFNRPTDGSGTCKLADFKGRPLVLYFYPKDDTPGCTKEACAFRDQKKSLKQAGVQLVGISPDDQASHEKFRDKYQLNFPLWVDKGHKVAEKFGAWREKNMYGKITVGVIRSTVLIDPQGRVARHWKRVKAKSHASFVRKSLEELSGS